MILPFDSWSAFKQLVDNLSLPLLYVEYASVYDIYGLMKNGAAIHIELKKDGGADVTDWETNYKPTANQDFSPSVSVNQPVTIQAATADGLTISGNIQTTVPQPLEVQSATLEGMTTTAAFSKRSDTFTDVGAGVAIECPNTPAKSYALQVAGTGAEAANWDARLEGSLNGFSFSTILRHTKSTGDSEILWSNSALSPALYFRSRVDTLVLGSASNVVVTILGVP